MKGTRTARMVFAATVLWICMAWSPQASAQGGYPRTFTDGKGHKLTLKAKPMRIASVVLGMDENLVDLVEPSRIVTMTELALDPNISNVADRAPKGKILIRDRWQPVVDAKPDLVLVATYTPTLADPLIARGLPVYQFSEFSSIDALLKNFEILGQLVGEEQKAQKIISAHRAALSKASTKKWPKPIRAIHFSEGFVVAAGTVPSQVMAAAGVVDVAAEFGLTGFVKATPTLMKNLKPDAILIGEDSKEAENETKKLFQGRDYQVIDAARAGRVYAIPGKHITTVSHNVVKAVEDLQALLSK